MLKYELGVAGAGLAEERRDRVWCCCVLEEEENGTGCSGVVILKTGAVEGRMVVGMWVKERALGDGSRWSDRV